MALCRPADDSEGQIFFRRAEVPPQQQGQLVLNAEVSFKTAPDPHGHEDRAVKLRLLSEPFNPDQLRKLTGELTCERHTCVVLDALLQRVTACESAVSTKVSVRFH